MDAFARDFSQHWLAGQSGDSNAVPARPADDEALSPSMKEALDALTERINAARSIV
jgi:hypothetical protein